MVFSDEKFKFFLQMFAYGKNEFDYDLQFFYYYVLFNFLYNLHDDEVNPRSSENERRKKNEEERIKAFVGYVVQNDSAYFSNYNPFAQLNSCMYIELIEKVEVKIGKVNLEYSKKSTEREIKALFLEIYNIRCDIFHGGKNFTDAELRRLIFGCNEVFNQFFDFYFQTLICSPKNEKKSEVE
ncbi:hypothetical protein [Treponema succinifaciens]|uniref:hypothetical protein n=1 Tax=Treponema succinifaciens TaxID=167 RepID=UPI003FF0E0C2